MTKHLICTALGGCLLWAAASTPAWADPIEVEVEVGPRYVERYPQTVYEGRPVYYYDDHWYYQRGPRWVYYREEPRPLIEYRESPAFRERYEHRHYDRGPRHHEHWHGHHHGHGHGHHR
jgi:hypothetical protein